MGPTTFLAGRPFFTQVIVFLAEFVEPEVVPPLVDPPLEMTTLGLGVGLGCDVDVGVVGFRSTLTAVPPVIVGVGVGVGIEPFRVSVKRSP